MIKSFKKGICAILVLALGCPFLSGCRKNVHSQDVVNARMNLLVTHNYEGYSKALGKDMDEAKVDYQLLFDEKRLGSIPGTTKEEYALVMQTLLSKVKVNVKGAAEKRKTAKVKVKVRPLMLYRGQSQEFKREFTDYVNQVSEAIVTGKEIPKQNRVNPQIVDIFEKGFRKPRYGPPKTVILHLERDKNHQWVVREEDETRLLEVLFDESGLSQYPFKTY